MSGEQLGFEGILEQSTDDGATWEEIVNVTNVPIPAEEPEFVEVTSLSSGRSREYVPGMTDIGEISIRQNFSRAGWQQQAAAEGLGTLVSYRWTMSNGDAFQWNGYPRTRMANTDIPNQHEFDTVVRGSGALTYTPGS